MKKYTEYARHAGCDRDVIDWIGSTLSAYLKKNTEDQTEIEHILDYMASDKRPKRISKMSYDQAKGNTDKWNRALIKKGENIKETPEDTTVIKDFGDGFKIVKLVGRAAYDREGFLMRHCVSEYFGKSAEIYSLRDKDNMPHATMEKDQQIKGKGNGSINPKYVGYIVAFLEEVGMTVGDSEMRNLGYANIEKLLNKIDKKKTRLFNGKYLYEDDEVYGKDGEPYSELDIWDYKPLLSLDSSLTINFDLKVFLKASICTLLKVKKTKSSSGNSAQIGSSGNSAQIGSSGYSAQIGSSGNSAQIGSSGYSAKIGSSGNSAKIGSSGNSAKIGSSGDYAQIGSSGYSAKIGSSGYYAQIGSSGNSAQIGSSGNSAQIGSSGYYAKIGSSGDYAQIDVTGEKSIAATVGPESSIKAPLGTPIAIAEYSQDGTPKRFVCGVIGEDGLLPDVYYTVKDGKFVEAA